MGYYIYLSVRTDQVSFRNYGGERYATPEWKNAAYGFYKRLGEECSVRVFSCNNPPIYMMTESKELNFTVEQLGRTKFELKFGPPGEGYLVFTEENPLGESARSIRRLYPDRIAQFTLLNRDASEERISLPAHHAYDIRDFIFPNSDTDDELSSSSSSESSLSKIFAAELGQQVTTLVPNLDNVD